MDPLITQALRAGRAPVHRRSGGARVLVAGAGGTLGAAVLEQLLGRRAFVQVSVLVNRAFGSALAGLNPVAWPLGTAGHAALAGIRSAIVVFDRERHANGRDLAYWRPDPAALPDLAARLRHGGVRHLLVVLPHDAATLPQALRRGLANLDEQAVASLGFEHLVFMRAAQAAPGARPSHPGERLAHWMLSQLQLMVPQRDRPVRAAKVGAFAAELAAQLPSAPPGTRVVPPELVWEVAQADDPKALSRAWLHAGIEPDSPVPAPRL
jgi:nucleoside-diphosphate-sugar epimerase